MGTDGPISLGDGRWGGPGTAGWVRRAVGWDIRPEHTFGRQLGARFRQTEPGPDVLYRTGLPTRRQQR